MTTNQLRSLLSELGLSQRAAARLLDVNERTMRRYCAGEPIPRCVELALLYMQLTGLSSSDEKQNERHQKKSDAQSADAEITLLRAQLREAEEVIKKLLLCTTFNDFDHERYKARKFTVSLEQLLKQFDTEDN